MSKTDRPSVSKKPTKNSVEIDGVETGKILYPTGIPPDEDDLRSLRTQRGAEPARPSSFFFISNKFESLDYMKIINRLEIEMEKKKTFRMKVKEDFLRIMYFMIGGVGTALIGVFLEYATMALAELKYEFLSDFIQKHFEGSVADIILMTLLWFLGVIIPVMIGSSLVVFVAPFAAGGGVAQCIAYLNGVRVPKVLSMKVAAVKAIGTICTVISGLAGGKEGPMMHLGTAIGGSLPSALPWKHLKSEHERRDLAAAGFGGGIAVAFGAPVGGLLLAIEEGISFWDIRLMWQTYVGILIAYLVSTLLLSCVEHVPGDLTSTKLLILGKISEEVTNYEMFELFFFALEGVIGGLIGASLVKIHIYFTLFRKRFIHIKRKRKLLEAFVVALFVAGASLLAIMTMKTCLKIPSPKSNTRSEGKAYPKQLSCGKDEYSDLARMLFQDETQVIQSMFQPGDMHLLSLGVFCVLYYIFFNMTMGLTIPAGVFVPQLVIGAVWGRLYGSVLKLIFPSKKWVKPAKYAFMGASAQLSGFTGKSFSVLVIMVEASGSISLSIPLMVIVTVARVVENFFVLPIYETQMHLAGMPFLPSAPPPLSASVPTSYVMSPDPLVTIPLNPTVQAVLRTLDSNTHNGFPVITKEGNVGLVLRQQLLVLLKYEAYKYPTPFTPKQMWQCLGLYLKYARLHIHFEDIEVEPKYMNVVLDLSPYYNPYPYTVKESMPLNYTYSLFRNLGLRHIIVMNDHNEATAMITRKDLAKFHTWEGYGKLRVIEMLVK